MNISLDLGTKQMIDRASESMKMTRLRFLVMAAARMVGVLNKSYHTVES